VDRDEWSPPSSVEWKPTKPVEFISGEDTWNSEGLEMYSYEEDKPQEDMVSRVVEVLDEGSPFMNPQRVLHSRLPKKRPRKRFVRPSKSTGERDEYERSKERDRKFAKERHPNSPQKWNGKRWTTERWTAERNKVLDEYGITQVILDNLDHAYHYHNSIEPLTEISWRTVGIGATLLKVKQYAGQFDSVLQKLKSLGSQLQTAKDEKERNKIDGEIVKTNADLLQSLRRMEVWSSLVPASGLVGLEKSILKKLKSKPRRR
jgi:hypothetical protein